MVMELEKLASELTDAQVSQLHELLDFRMATKAASFTTMEIDAYDALSYVLQGNLMPLYKLASKDGVGRGKFTSFAKQLFQVIDSGSGQALKRPLRLALAREALSCMSEYLAEIGRPVSSRVMITMIEWLPHALDQCYPGYMNAKMLHKIARFAAA